MTGPTVKCRVDLGTRRARPVAPRAEATPLAAPGPPTPPSGPTAPAARVLALAHWIERGVRAGRFTSYRDAARHLGVSHARVQHVVGLVFLPATVQAMILSGALVTVERSLRVLARQAEWSENTAAMHRQGP